MFGASLQMILLGEEQSSDSTPISRFSNSETGVVPVSLRHAPHQMTLFEFDLTLQRSTNIVDKCQIQVMHIWLWDTLTFSLLTYYLVQRLTVILWHVRAEQAKVR